MQTIPARYEELLTISQVAEAAVAALSGYGGQPNGQVSELPTVRTLRYYTSLGLLDPPTDIRGRRFLYSARHVAQVVAIKLMQARGMSLAEIQATVPALSEAELAGLAGTSGATVARRRRYVSERFWSAVREAPALASAPWPVERPAEVGASVRLAEGVLLAMERGPVDERLASRIIAAAKPLVELLVSAGICKRTT